MHVNTPWLEPSLWVDNATPAIRALRTQYSAFIVVHHLRAVALLASAHQPSVSPETLPLCLLTDSPRGPTHPFSDLYWLSLTAS